MDPYYENTYPAEYTKTIGAISLKGKFGNGGQMNMPMTGVFASMATGETGNGGTIALLIWCVYFFPIGVLAYKHFEKSN